MGDEAVDRGARNRLLSSVVHHRVLLLSLVRLWINYDVKNLQFTFQICIK